MDVETAVREIDEAVHKHVGGTEEGYHEAVRNALETVEETVGGDGVDELTRFVDGHVRENEERPSVTAVEERAAEIIRDHGEAVPADSPLQNV